MDAADEEGERDSVFLNAIRYRRDAGGARLLRRLLDDGANVNARGSDGKTALHIVANCGWRDERKFIQMLLESGADANAKDSNADTPLHFIANTSRAGEQRLGCARLLINGRADVNAANKMGKTPLGLAASKCNKELVKLLLTQGAKLGDKEKEFEKLRGAVEEGRLDLDCTNKTSQECVKKESDRAVIETERDMFR